MKKTQEIAGRIGILVLLGIVGMIFSGCGNDVAKPLKMGDPAPIFSVPDLHGEMVTLDTYQNKPVVIRFFLPDCKYCRADTAVFNEYYQKYRDKGLGVIYVNTAPRPDDVEKFVSDLGITFSVVLDPERKIADQYRIQIVPQTVVLNPEHKIIGAILGGVSKEQLDSL
ncbi:MAG: TlpA disulfide reductase family protein, partial [Desulfobulbaceae bacterium]|nr:TlpA disulfide reductase family protein [Desulfobulbaceae bacterium]